MDREFVIRSQGHVRAVTLTARQQIAAIVAVCLLVLTLLAALGAVTMMGLEAKRERAALAARESKAASAEGRLAGYRADLDEVAGTLAERQAFIEKLVDAYIDEVPAGARDGGADKTPEGTDTSKDAPEGDAARIVRKLGAVLPEASLLATLEERQLALVSRLTLYAQQRADRAAKSMRTLGLNPAVILAPANELAARGGPYVGLAAARDGDLDQRFRRLGTSLARMEALERSLDRVPQVRPAHLDFVSSSYGYRSDPFTGQAAFHSGLDFPGPAGASIFAAAKGVVSFVGTRAGYGNCIEITHGKGLMTRYAHLSGFSARVGQKVEPGDRIGAMGSTGRSTGPHLHFEVRVNGRAVNPRPFLEAQHDHPDG